MGRKSFLLCLEFRKIGEGEGGVAACVQFGCKSGNFSVDSTCLVDELVSFIGISDALRLVNSASEASQLVIGVCCFGLTIRNAEFNSIFRALVVFLYGIYWL